MRINHRKQHICVILTFVAVQILWMGLSPAWGDGSIDNISLKKNGNYTQVTVYGNRPFEFTHSIEGAKDGKPNRLIIDCRDMVFNLPQHDFKSGLPPGFVSAIRTSQYQVDPRKIVRIVLDLKNTAVYKVLEAGSESKATLAIMTNQGPDFPTWLAVKENPDEKRFEKKVESTENAKMVKIETGTERSGIPGMKTEKPNLITPTEPLAMSETTPAETQVELPQIKNTTSTSISDKLATKNTYEDRTHTKTVSYADTGETEVPLKKEPLLVYQTKTPIEKKEETNTVNKVPTTVTVQTGNLPESKTIVQTASVPNDKLTSVSLPNAGTKKAEIYPLKQEVPSSKDAVIPTPAQVKVQLTDKQSTVLSPGTTEMTAQPSPGRTVNRSSVPLGPYLEDKPYTKESTGNTPTTMAQTETGDKTTDTPGTESPMKKGIGAVLGTKEVSAEESDSTTRVMMSIQNPLQIDLGVIPSRKLITYNPETRRDPFLPLTEKEDMQFGDVPLPQFENLKLVGIIKDTRGNEALLEDEIGFGYILKSGDRIKNGYVMSIEENKVIFHVEEYGGFKIMTLELNPEY